MSARNVVVELHVNVRPYLMGLTEAGVRSERILAKSASPDGWLARYYIRGGMDPRFAHPEARDRYAQTLASVVSPDAAARFLQGWVDGHKQPVAGPTAWHRQFGGTRILVGGAA